MGAQVSAARLREVLKYDPTTGAFVWIKKSHPRSNTKIGDVAGCRSRGYWVIAIDGVLYGAHRLAWLYMTGEMPRHEVDHIDGNGANNAFANLRDVTKRTNQENLKSANRGNKSCGLLGVTACRNKWRAAITVDGQARHIGVFDTPEAAHAAYVDAKRVHHRGCTL